jgi:hypothetical protein
MKLKIKDETPIKYHLNMHLMKSFIERDSIGFELIKYVVNEIEANDKKELTFENMKFTSKTLKYVFGDQMKDEEFKEYIISKLKEMISLNWINPKNKSMFITEEMITNFYNINK